MVTTDRAILVAPRLQLFGCESAVADASQRQLQMNREQARVLYHAAAPAPLLSSSSYLRITSRGVV